MFFLGEVEVVQDLRLRYTTVPCLLVPCPSDSPLSRDLTPSILFKNDGIRVRTDRDEGRNGYVCLRPVWSLVFSFFK